VHYGRAHALQEVSLVLERGVLAVVDETTAPHPIPPLPARASWLSGRLGPAAAAAAVLVGFAGLALVSGRLRPETPRDERAASLALPIAPPSSPLLAVPATSVAPTPPPAPAQVRIAAWPWAEVRVDDGAPFFTPRAEPLALAPGTHHVVFEHARFGRAERTIEVGPGQELVVRHDFAEQEGS